MDTEKKITERIMAITTEITEKYPELLKFTGEMPNVHSNHPGSNLTALIEYCESLETVLEKFSISHSAL